jgi:hypothetical protein
VLLAEIWLTISDWRSLTKYATRYSITSWKGLEPQVKNRAFRESTTCSLRNGVNDGSIPSQDLTGTLILRIRRSLSDSYSPPLGLLPAPVMIANIWWCCKHLPDQINRCLASPLVQARWLNWDQDGGNSTWVSPTCRLFVLHSLCIACTAYQRRTSLKRFNTEIYGSIGISPPVDIPFTRAWLGWVSFVIALDLRSLWLWIKPWL